MMKKTHSIIKHIVYLLLLCGVCFLYSCYSNCSKYEITQQETELLSAYNQGDIAVFKNDSTSVIDTLHVIEKDYGSTYYDEPCNKSIHDALGIQIVFSHLHDCGISIEHNKTPEIHFSYTSYEFPLSGSLQSMTINGITYEDIFITSVDSTMISTNDHNQIPWKIDYSKSKGFVRFYMVNGETWSKQ